MKTLKFILLTTLVLSTGCKQAVDFSANESSERTFEIPDVPVDPSPMQAPKVKIVQGPESHKLGNSSQVVFEVLKGDNDIESVQCFVDQYELSCDWLKGVLPLIGFKLGLHQLEIIATDVEGLVGKASEEWSVFDRFRAQKDSIDVSRKGKADILFVIDNSSSMRAEQKKISKRFDKFIEKIEGLDWHLGITTTDTRGLYDWSDGLLSPFENGYYYLNSQIGSKKAQKLFAKNVRRKESGSDSEKGILAVSRSISRANKPASQADKALEQFFRPEAALAVVVVSDEDESGPGSHLRGRELLNLVDQSWGATKTFQFNSIIVHTNECLNGEGKSYGQHYERLSHLTGGSVGDVCADNYSQLLEHLGQGVADLQKVYNLKCVPQDVDKDGNPDLVVVPKGPYKVPGYTLDKRRIEFDQPLKPGAYQFHYFCLD